MDKFWKEIFNRFLGSIYEKESPEDNEYKTWCDLYEYECKNMLLYIEEFAKSAKAVGMEISNHSMMQFMIYEEYEHIRNNIKSVNETELLIIAADVNNELF